MRGVREAAQRYVEALAVLRGAEQDAEAARRDLVAAVANER